MASYDQSCRCRSCGSLLSISFSKKIGFSVYCAQCDTWSGICENCLQITDIADMSHNLCIECAILIHMIAQKYEQERLHQPKES